jgi:hypothetical protein
MGVLQDVDDQKFEQNLLQLLKRQGTIEILISCLCPSFPRFYFTSFYCPFSN